MKSQSQIFISLFFLLLIISSCKKEELPPEGGNKIEIGATTIDNYSYRTATISTMLTSTGRNQINQHGHCWSMVKEPTIEDKHTRLGSKDNAGKFTSELDSLTPGGKYYVRSYVTFSQGTIYGEEKEFSTINTGKPVVTTSEVQNVTLYAAQCGGVVENDSGLVVTARGVCWNTTGTPTLEDCITYTSDSSGTGTFTSQVTGLQEATNYFISAYASNEKGTSYGEVKSFIAEDPPCGELSINYGGQIYHTVKIGGQCWFKENLNIGSRINGTQNQQNNSTIEKYCYDDQESNCDEYGGLYQWDETMQYVTTQGAQGICPEGWHIPTDNEWKILEGTVDSQYGVGDLEWDETDWRGFDAGYHLKSTTGWYSNGDGDDYYGFLALPGGGWGYYGGFFSLGVSAHFWSSTEYSGSYAWYRYLYYDSGRVVRVSINKTYGFSARCLQD